MKTVIVKWRDSNIFNEQWGEDEEEFEVSEITSIGFLIKDEKDRIVIAREKVGEDWRGIIAIPRENIISLDSINNQKP